MMSSDVDTRLKNMRVAFRQARQRCENPRNKDYHNYGARGIEMRFHSFEEFYSHIGPRPSPGHTVDRKNGNGHYEVGNVRWATPKEQSRNRTDSAIITLDDRTQSLPSWAAELGINKKTLRSRWEHGERPPYLFRPARNYRERRSTKKER